MISSSIIPPFSMFCLAFTLYVFIASELEILLLCCCWDCNHTHKSPLILLCFNKNSFSIINLFQNVPHDRAWLVVQFDSDSYPHITHKYIKKYIFCRKANLRNLLLKWILFGIIGAGEERCKHRKLLKFIFFRKFHCWRFRMIT